MIGGYSETGRRNTATPPSNMITNAMTFASTGRSMKNLANMAAPDADQDSVAAPACCSRMGNTFRPGTRVQDSIYHHAIGRDKSAREWRSRPA